MSVPLGHGKHDSRIGAITSRSLVEALSGKHIRRLLQERLRGWLSSSERVEPDRVRVEIDLAADEALGPQGVNGEGAPEQLDTPALRRAPDEDDHALGMGLQIRLPLAGEGAPRRGRLDPLRSTAAKGLDVALGTLLKGGKGIVVEPRPHLRLPSPVEVFDGSLEPALAGRDEHGGDGQPQTGPQGERDRFPGYSRPRWRINP